MSTIKTIRFRILMYTFTDSLKAIFSDSGALLILIFAALMYPVVYSIAYEKEVLTDMPIIVVDNDNTALSRKLINMFDACASVNVVSKTNDMFTAENQFWESTGNAVVKIPKGFERDIIRGNQAFISMYADASNFLYYKETFRSTMRASGTLAAGVTFKRLVAKGENATQAIHKIQPLKTSSYNLFNPAGGYLSFVMPGIMLVILQQTLLIGIGLVGGAGRERKRSVEDLASLPVNRYPFEVIIGKSMAYFLIGMFNIVFSTVLVYHWFSYPAKGNLLEALMLAVPFLLSTIFLGLAISVLFKHREHSIMVLVFLSPVVLFISGLSWPTDSMPTVLHQFFKLFPSTQMVPAFIRIRTMGASLTDVKPEYFFMLIQMVVYYLLAVFGFKASMKRQHD